VLVLLFVRQLIVVQPLDDSVAFLFTRVPLGFGQLVAGLVQGLFDAEHVALQLVLGRYLGLLTFVLVSVPFGIAEHAIDFGLRQATLVVFDDDVLGASGAVVLGRHVQNPVGVQIESHLDFGHASGRRRDAGQVERSQQVVVLGHGPLPFEHLDGDGRLVVRVRGERLGLFARDGGIAVDDFGHHAARGLDAQRQGGDVYEQHVLDRGARVAAEDGRLYRRTVRHRFVGVDGQVERFAAEIVLQETLDLRDPRRTAHEHHVVYVSLVHLGVGQRLLHRDQGRSEQVGAQLLEPRPGHPGVEIDAVHQGVDLDDRLGAGRQRSLGPFGGRPQPSQRSRVGVHVLLEFPLELLGQMRHQPVVEVFAAQVRVARRRLHFEYRTLVDLQNGHVERAAAQVEYQHVLLSLQVLVQTVRQSRGRRFVDDPHHVQAGYDTRVLGRLSLRVVEVRRHRDDGVRHVSAQVRFGGLLHFRQHHRTDLFGREHFSLAFEFHLDFRLTAVVYDFERPVFDVRLRLLVVETTSDQTFGVEHRVDRVHRHLVLGRVADQPFGVGERHITRGGPVTLIVGDHLDFTVLPYTHTRICGTQIDADCCSSGHFDNGCC